MVKFHYCQEVYIGQCKPPDNIYFFHYYNGSGTVMARWDWKIPTSSFEVWKYPPLPSASPRDIGRYCQTSQDSVGIFQSHLAMTVPLSQFQALSDTCPFNLNLKLDSFKTQFIPNLLKYKALHIIYIILRGIFGLSLFFFCIKQHALKQSRLFQKN